MGGMKPEGLKLRRSSTAACLVLASVLVGTVLAGGSGTPAAHSSSVPSPRVTQPPALPLKGRLNAPGRDASLTALSTDQDGAPVLAWVEHGPAGNGGADQLRAAHWSGAAWIPMGGALNENPAHNVSQLTAASGPDGRPWLGWSEDAGTAHVDSYLMSRWDGQRWSDPGRYAVRRNLSDAGRSRAFAVTASNTPFLAWTNIYYPGARAGVVQPFTWLGGRWDERALPLNVSVRSAAFFPAAARSPGQDGTLYAAWLEGDVAHSSVYVKRLERGGAWTPLGGALNSRPRTYTFAPQLAAGRTGVVAAWLEDQGGIDTLFVRRWTGQRWVPLGAGLNVSAGQFVQRPNLALDLKGNPVVAWVEGQDGARRVYAKRWTGRAWTLLGAGALNLKPQRDARSASVTVDGQNRAVVAWCGQAEAGLKMTAPGIRGYDVQVRRFGQDGAAQ